MSEKTRWPVLVFALVFFLGLFGLIFLPLFVPATALPIIGSFFLLSTGIILAVWIQSSTCPSCAQRFAVKVLERKAVDAFNIHFHEGELPASDAIRSTFTSKLHLEESDVSVETLKNGTAARVVLPKNVLSKKLISERDPTIWGPDGTGPARGWCTRIALAQEREERRKKHFDRTFSELWRPTWAGDASLIRFACKKCEHTWTRLRIDSGD